MENNENPPEENEPQPLNAEPVLKKDEQMWAMFCHLSSLAWIVGIPFANVLGPLIVWLIKRNEMPLVDKEGKNH